MTEEIALRPARAGEFEYVFALHKEGLGGYIRRAWGWDEDFQRQGLRREFDAGQFEIAEGGGRAVGMISTTVHPDHLYLHHIIVAAEHRRRGIGTTLMRVVLERAAARRLPLRLSVFHENPARALYARLGFRLIHADEHRQWLEAP